MYDRYSDISKFITDPDKLTIADGECVYISGESYYDIAVDLEGCYGSFDEVKPFIAFLAGNINELDNTVQRFGCRNGGGYDPTVDETPFELELVKIYKPNTVALGYFCTDVNSQFDAVFEYIDGQFFLRSFGTVRNIPNDWEKQYRKRS